MSSVHGISLSHFNEIVLPSKASKAMAYPPPPALQLSEEALVCWRGESSSNSSSSSRRMVCRNRMGGVGDS